MVLNTTKEPLTVAHIGVGLALYDDGNTHTGVAFRSAKNEVMFFHQAWHYQTRCEALKTEIINLHCRFLCAIPTIDEIRAAVIAAFWENVAARGMGIAYALQDDPEAMFDEHTGALVLPNGIGLSCSTFVLALFKSVRFPLIDTVGWPIGRTGDIEAQKRLVAMLQSKCMDIAHVDAVRKEIGCERVRPEEVAGSAGLPKQPVRYINADLAGAAILKIASTLSKFTG